jgi:hydrogenase nickel incorporation protein HypB
MSVRTISIEEAVQGRNDTFAAHNRAVFRASGLIAVNVMSAPGSGKTELLSRLLFDLVGEARMAVIVGDIATDNDARRLGKTGVESVQITTNGYCHLDAEMVGRALAEMDLDRLDLLLIENVGNLVCPATFDLGEDFCVAVISVTEGEDKPLKYPTLFKLADVILVNKIDLAEAVGYDRETAMANIKGVAPQARVFEVSARTGQGLKAWYEHLRRNVLEYSRGGGEG